MALPPNGTAWPPPNAAHIHAAYAAWSAWYANDTELLRAAYTTNNMPQQGSATHRRGFINRVTDWFWTPKASDGESGALKLHVPVGSDLCQVSADLLYSEPPTFTIEDHRGKNKNVQDRLDLITGAGLDQTLIAAGEVSAALGGVYLRATWDDSLYDHVFLTKVDADGAVPTFRYGRLVAVTFWRVVGLDGNQFIRHLEHHSLDAFGTGVIEHGLFSGSATDLGVRVPLADAEATAGLGALVDDQSQISTQTPGLAVEYLPNIGPNRRWRNDPNGANLGRSDLDGIEPLMDALDRTYSSWMRDLELGKARLILPQAMLTDMGPGKGASFDNDRALYQGVNAAPGSAADAKLAIEQVQFGIRVQEHADTAAALFAQIVRSAGYSSQTFGEKDESTGDRTATEVMAKERRSYLTRDRKIRAASPGLERILFKALATDAVLFGTGLTPAPVTVTFADAVQDTIQALATTVNLLKQAEAASIETRVKIMHPDWDPDDVAAEVDRIRAEASVFPDPMFMHPNDGTVTDAAAAADAGTGQPAGNG